MADWSKPVVTDLYADVLSYIDARLDETAGFFATNPTNLPAGAMRFVRASGKFQEWDGAAWNDKVIGVAGGGTGGTDANTARIALGLGTISVQNANAVAITGGSATGITALGMTGDISFNIDGANKIGANGNRPSVIYLRNGLVIPVGTDKWVSG
jgi:hypothetical protein